MAIIEKTFIGSCDDFLARLEKLYTGIVLRGDDEINMLSQILGQPECCWEKIEEIRTEYQLFRKMIDQSGLEGRIQNSRSFQFARAGDMLERIAAHPFIADKTFLKTLNLVKRRIPDHV